MAKKTKLFSGQSLIVTLKGIGVSIVTGLVFLVLFAIARAIENTAIDYILYIGGIVLYLFLWGFLAGKFWKWK